MLYKASEFLAPVRGWLPVRNYDGAVPAPEVQQGSRGASNSELSQILSVLECSALDGASTVPDALLDRAISLLPQVDISAHHVNTCALIDLALRDPSRRVSYCRILAKVYRPSDRQGCIETVQRILQFDEMCLSAYRIASISIQHYPRECIAAGIEQICLRGIATNSMGIVCQSLVMLNIMLDHGHIPADLELPTILRLFKAKSVPIQFDAVFVVAKIKDHSLLEASCPDLLNALSYIYSWGALQSKVLAIPILHLLYTQTNICILPFVEPLVELLGVTNAIRTDMILDILLSMADTAQADQLRELLEREDVASLVMPSVQTINKLRSLLCSLYVHIY